MNSNDERIILVAIGMAMANKSVINDIDISGTELADVIDGLREIPFDATPEQYAASRNGKDAVVKFLISLGFEAVLFSEKTDYVRMVVGRANKISLWHRAKAWLRKTYSLLLIPKGNIDEKIKRAKQIGYTDHRDGRAVGGSQEVESGSIGGVTDDSSLRGL